MSSSISATFIRVNHIPRPSVMITDDALKRTLLIYISLIMPVLLILLAVIAGAGFLVFVLLLSWFGSMLLIVFLPTSPEAEEQ